MNSPYMGDFKVTQEYKGNDHDGLDLVGIASKEIHSTVNGIVTGSSSPATCPARPIPRRGAPSTPGALPAPNGARRSARCCASLRGAGIAPATWWRSARA